MMDIKAILGLTYRNRKWRKRNPHNFTTVENFFDMDQVEVGNKTYGGINAITCGKEYKLRIGHFCSIATGVCFVLQGEHRIDTISTYPFHVQVMKDMATEALSRGDIIVKDDAWIGENALIMSGVTLGQGCIVAAGAVVTKDVPPYAIVGGVPAKVIRYRFTEAQIEKLIQIDYSKLTDDMIQEHIDELYQSVDDNTELSWITNK